ncbi:HNH endonuclease [Chitinophaga rhizosphaerae]|uniref:HNH endonuclease n=1 Tax=Chitinophaga rhizosphaerae TaxID=1864947 RepID=UPI000F804AB7|nr:HNH endonuclease [Chitinophaga rhizosphaerae]
MMICYNCNTRLEPGTLSEEHIFPQAIGGRLTSLTLLCKKCNEHYGATIDANLAKSFEFFVAMLMLDRERSEKIPVIKNLVTDSGEKYSLRDGRFPESVEPPVTVAEGGKSYHISARNEKEFETIIRQFKDRFPEIDLEDVRSKAVRSKSYMDKALHGSLTLGGEQGLRAVAKIALNFYLHSGGDRTAVGEILPVIKGEISNEQHAHLYYIIDSLELSGKEVFHFVQVNGDPTTGLLYAYVVLFSSIGYMVTLSENYRSEKFEKSFAYDVVTLTKLEKKVITNYEGRLSYVSMVNDANMARELNSKIINSIQSHLNRIMAVAEHLQYTKGVQDYAQAAITKVLQNLNGKDVSVKDFSQQVMDIFMKDAAPFFEHFLKKRKYIQRNDATEEIPSNLD